jgi:hypothetical protein
MVASVKTVIIITSYISNLRDKSRELDFKPFTGE